jgi:hypothetical protein
MPCRKSSRGSGRGAIASVPSQFTSASASWLDAISAGDRGRREQTAAHAVRERRADRDRGERDRDAASARK